MNLRILSDTPAHHKELVDVASLFFGRVNLTEDDSDLTARFTERLEGGARVCGVVLSGCVAGAHTTRGEVGAGALEQKRLHKRQVKLTLYYALKQATGIAPPWGALTGIRPTRLVYEAMARGLSLEAACLETRRLFDLSAEKTRLLEEVVRAQAALPAPAPRDVDVYIGIPFCVSRCRYCSFISAEVGDGAALAPYVAALAREIAAVERLIAEHGLSVRAFYMGGGTPTALTAPLLHEALSAAGGLIARTREATVEAGRPDTIDAEKLRIIRAAGVGRISVNPQTMHDATLALIGRAHTGRDAEEAMALARAAGFHGINMDLIAGLPGEDATMFSDTLAWVRGMRPDNLTVHTLCVKRSSDMHRWQDALPDGAAVSHMADLGFDAARGMGMRPYYLYRQKHMAGNLENVGYALPGSECLYNVDTMEDHVSVLALGAGGISKRVWPDRALIVRAANVKDVSGYIERVDEMAERKVALWRQDAFAG